MMIAYESKFVGDGARHCEYVAVINFRNQMSKQMSMIYHSAAVPPCEKSALCRVVCTIRGCCFHASFREEFLHL